MGSDIHIARVVSDTLLAPPLHEQLQHYTPQRYADYLRELRLPDATIETAEDFVANVRRHREALGPIPHTGRLVSARGFDLLRNTTAPADLPEEMVPLLSRHAAGLNLLAALHPSPPDPILVRRIRFSVALVHPDGWLPPMDPPNHRRLRGFLLRLLCEAHPDGLYGCPIEAYFSRFGMDTVAQPDYGGHMPALHGFLWDVRCTGRTRLLVDDPDFWAAHKDEWWAEHRHQWSGPSDNTPFEVAEYQLDTHPAWAGTLVEDNFDSRTY